jgi:glucose-6-phosphate 1-dehydrogenase
VEIGIVFKRPPRFAFAVWLMPEPGRWILRIDPSPGVYFSVQAKQPGKKDTRRWTLTSSCGGARRGARAVRAPAQRCKARQGKASLFAREDSVEETWRIVQPLLERAGDPGRY